MKPASQAHVQAVYDWVGKNFVFEGSTQHVQFEHAKTFLGNEDYPEANVQLVLVNTEEGGFYQCGIYYFNVTEEFQPGRRIPTYNHSASTAKMKLT